MTVIARVTEDAVSPDLILNAGKVFSGSDSGAELWGSDRPIWWLTFEGREGASLLVAERDGRWIVEAAGPYDPTKTIVIEPRSPLPPPRFEDFRRDIGREP
ncbi:MAG: hypothetical protein WAP03_17570 [Methylorubrum rhodinum]|uniref:hypothetical protein n=1 Tax=Methylorubrum rhodinum TaxID=29428 RepID=UPI003BB08B6D